MNPTVKQIKLINSDMQRLNLILLSGFGYDSQNNINFECYSKDDANEFKEIYRGSINNSCIKYMDIVELRKL